LAYVAHDRLDSALAVAPRDGNVMGADVNERRRVVKILVLVVLD
jgi:hypothetical protein